MVLMVGQVLMGEVELKEEQGQKKQLTISSFSFDDFCLLVYRRACSVSRMAF